jgi:hypothetical protein
MDLLRKMILPQGTPEELLFVAYQARRTGLDPISRQLYVFKQTGEGEGAGKLVFGCSIDAFRLISNRAGAWAGMEGPFFTDGTTCEACQGKGCEICDSDRFAWTACWLLPGNPKAAKVRMYRNGWDRPVVVYTQWDAYAQVKDSTPCPKCGKTGTIIKGREEYGGGFLCFAKKGGCGAKFEKAPPFKGTEGVGWWGKGGGAQQLGKCCEARAHRMIAPQELSGLYEPSELEQDTRFVQLGGAEIPPAEVTAVVEQETLPPAREKPRTRKVEKPSENKTPPPADPAPHPDPQINTGGAGNPEELPPQGELGKSDPDPLPGENESGGRSRDEILQAFVEGTPLLDEATKIKLITAFEQKGVTVEQLEAFFGCDTTQFTNSIYNLCREIFTDIKAGIRVKEDLYGLKTPADG